MDAAARHRADEGEAVGAYVDRTAPGVSHANVPEIGQQASEALLRPARRRRVVREAPVDPVAVADRAGAAAHQHASVRRRAEVVEEHAPVGDRLAPGPADLLEQLRDRLGEDDVAAEDGQPAANRLPVGGRRIDRDDRLGRADDAASRLEHVRRARAQPRDEGPLVELDPGVENRGTQRARQPGGMDGRAVAEEDSAPEDGRPAALGDLVPRERHCLLGMSERLSSLDCPFERLLLRRRRRDLEQAAFAQPDVGASSRGKGAYRGDDLAGGAAESQRSVVSEDLAQARER